MKLGLKELAAGRPFRIVCKGNSMSPRINIGDIKTIVPYDGVSHTLKEHDIVLVRIGSKFLTHQILSINDGIYVIANEKGKIDGEVTRDAILGIVAFGYTKDAGILIDED
jgi:phage repressor protein C with HTH and peptisase S24 domain